MTLWNIRLTRRNMTGPFRGVPAALALIGFVFASSTAKAGCGDPAQSGSAAASVIPFLARSDPAGQVNNNNSSGSKDRDHRKSIIGLWHVSFVMSNGTPFYQSFDLWHSDGTEIESANVSPLIGNVSVGVWEEIKPRTVRLHHVGWNFADGMLTGSFSLDQTNRVAGDGTTYRGTFLYQTYDLNGNLLQEVKGTQTATRIAVQSKNDQ